jgi:hypothetical protein
VKRKKSKEQISDRLTRKMKKVRRDGIELEKKEQRNGNECKNKKYVTNKQLF